MSFGGSLLAVALLSSPQSPALQCSADGKGRRREDRCSADVNSRRCEERASTDASNRRCEEANSLSGVTTWLRQQTEEWRRHEQALRLRLDSNNRPPPGAIYVATVNMPVIGSQTFMLRVTERQRCQIVLIGPLSLNEPASYTEEASESDDVASLVMRFNEPTLDLLRRWRTRIKATTWHRDGDWAELLVSPPLIPAIRIRMARTLPEDAPVYR